jgi:Uma2 family endonuclease
MTLESESKLVRRQADESYEIGENRNRPDLAIEVVITSSGINKLEAYKRLEITEVWFWEKECLSFYVLRGDHYELVQQSEVLSDLNIQQLMQALNEPDHLKAVREFRQAVAKTLGGEI